MTSPSNVPPRPCEGCGEMFQPYRPNGKTCSKACRKKSARAQEYEASRRADPEWRAARSRTFKEQYDPRREKARQLRNNHDGMTLEEYDAMLEAQGGGCAVCLRPPAEISLAIDHDHGCCPPKKSCAKCRRGLLCTPCNRALGGFDDDLIKVERAADYLRRTT